MLVAVAVGGDVLAHLPGDLVGHAPAHLPGLVMADLPGLLVAHLPGLIVADLPGDRDGDLPGDLVADLLGDSVANGVGDVPDNVGALGLGDLGTDWPLDQALLLDWDLLAHTVNLSLAGGGSGKRSSPEWGKTDHTGSGGNQVLGISVSLGLSITLVLLDGVWEGSQGSGGTKSSSKAGSSSRDLEASSNGGETTNNWASIKASVKGNWGSSNGWGSVDSSDSWGGSNRLDLDITLNSNQLGLLAHLK